jgi:pimeloyl-ACP methyl ester carboxylesterase
VNWGYVSRGKRCVAVFNSRGRTGNKYEWFGTLRELKYSAIHFSDDRGFWYHEDIDGILALLRTHKPDVMLGHSMGGYAALLFGSILGVRVEAIAPQTTLQAGWDDRWGLQWKSVREMTRHPEYLDLAGLKVDARVYYCKSVREDALHAERIEAQLFPRKCAGHDEALDNLDIKKALDPL